MLENVKCSNCIALFDSEALVFEFWGIWSTPSLPLLLSSLWSGVVVVVRVSSMGQIEL